MVGIDSIVLPGKKYPAVAPYPPTATVHWLPNARARELAGWRVFVVPLTVHWIPSDHVTSTVLFCGRGQLMTSSNPSTIYQLIVTSTVLFCGRGN